VENPGIVLSREQILHNMWGACTVDMYVAIPSLRQKVEKNPKITLADTSCARNGLQVCELSSALPYPDRLRLGVRNQRADYAVPFNMSKPVPIRRCSLTKVGDTEPRDVGVPWV